MRRTTLGRTGISVSRLCLGTMMLGAWGNADHDDAVRLVHTALDAGINFIDTADMYSGGESEEIVGKALKGRRDDVILATKVHFPMGDGTAPARFPVVTDPNRSGNSRRWIKREVENSLRRLGTDYIDLYQIHRPDPTTDIDETLSALSDLVREGKVMAIGSSDFPAEELVEARWVAERRNHVPFHTEQPPYSIFMRGVERAVLPTAQRHGMGVLTWSPLASGWLAGKFRASAGLELNDFRRDLIPHKFDQNLPGNARKLEIVEELVKLAADSGHRLTHLALGFVLSHPAVTSAIIGPRTVAQLDDLLGAVDVVLEDDVLDRIDQLVAPGTDLNPSDADHTPPALADAALRRRPRAERGA
ncbi:MULTISPECIES: aldo/keto reductase [unclassified Streptomyces]|uniref:aldo/keto reductase n=1 Tax=unclassified Streptomyces TaxID=2593676 RepID=UPI000361F284|nr:MULTISPECIES: aldo/keto reductase [unclassified Streptomyces]MYT34181.1 aldo/keto reductase [Streptomyces sp. SID8354]